MPPMQGMIFSGTLLPNLRRLFAGSAEAYQYGWEAVRNFHYNGDVIILAIFALVPIPLTKLYHKIYYRLATKLKHIQEKDYETSKIGAVGKVLSQGGRIASIVYVVELAVTFMVAVLSKTYKAPTSSIMNAKTGTTPKHLLPLQKFPVLFANCAYGFWLAQKVVKLKSRLLKKFYAKLPDPETYDRLLDFFIYVLGSIFVLESSNFDLGALVKSLVAIGGLSSIVVGLALQGPATQLLQGALLMAANKFRRNEQIKLGDGTQGKVVDIGLLETTIMSGDDVQTKIPNSKIAGQNFANLSRSKLSNVQFDLRFYLKDMDRVQDIIEAIRTEIVAACPKLITDGSRPFRIMWTDIKSDHIVVTVNTHHKIPPACQAYWENREQVLLAIAKATKQRNVKFAMPVTLRASLDT
eukprot:CAMPEP_0178922028 /NCGR_PEP_ID=MMETSP0786-20121207/15907_1 /TAXON_ID=186022 /ORGANISM="Thalassionema frauenfeldii, Strain CCMP 1798" /LENGTH=408 /DNA_ID=CAMNT_0020596309 /DNA_START=205 /DNA_END=1431 /DNA_ORIENTATION=-